MYCDGGMCHLSHVLPCARWFYGVLWMSEFVEKIMLNFQISSKDTTDLNLERRRLFFYHSFICPSLGSAPTTPRKTTVFRPRGNDFPMNALPSSEVRIGLMVRPGNLGESSRDEFVTVPCRRPWGDGEDVPSGFTGERA